MEFDKTLTSYLNVNPFKGDDFYSEKKKLEGSLETMNAQIKKLQEYYFKIGSEKESRDLIKKANELIDTTANLMVSLYGQVKNMHLSIDKKKLKKGEKIEKMKTTFNLEEECNKYKHRFDAVVYKIRKQDKSFVDSFKNSLSSCKSSTHTNSKYSPLYDKYKLTTPSKDSEKNHQTYAFEFIEDNMIENKEEQIKLITRVTKKLDDVSRETSLMLNQDREMVYKQSDFELMLELDRNEPPEIVILDPNNNKQWIYFAITVIAIIILIVMLIP